MTVERTSLLGDATAVFSGCGTYRYLLTRRWGAGPVVTFVMLNPSTADEQVLDPTVRRCIGFAQREGGGALQVVNLFALRSTDPRVLYDHADPVGPGNDDHIGEAAARSAVVIAGWGVHGALAGRGAAVRRLLAQRAAVHHLGLTKAGTRPGQPRHPLYLPAAAALTRWGEP